MYIDFYAVVIIIASIVYLFYNYVSLKKRIDNQDYTINSLERRIKDIIKNELANKEKTISEIKNDIEIVDNKKQHEQIVPKTEKEIIPQIEKTVEIVDSKNEIENDIETDYVPQIEIEPINKFINFLKDNFLTITGMITLVLGIGYFVKYAIDKEWISETARFYIGIAVGVSIVGLANRLRKNYNVFSSILTGGGISILYFALTISFHEYHLFSQNTTFFLLTIVTISSIYLGLRYNKELLVIFSLIGGFCAPFMAGIAESNYIFLFCYLILLNLSMLCMVWRKKWEIISLVSFVFTVAYSCFWINYQINLIQILFFFIFYSIFTASSLVNYFSNKIFSTNNCILLVTNTIVYAAIIQIIYNTIYYNDVLALFYCTFALINFIILYLNKNITKNKLLYNTTLSLVIVLFTLSIVFGFENINYFFYIKFQLIILALAMQSSILLFFWKQKRTFIFEALTLLSNAALIIFLIIKVYLTLETEQNNSFVLNFITCCSFVYNIYLLNTFKKQSLIFNNIKLAYTIISISFIYYTIASIINSMGSKVFHESTVLLYLLISPIYFSLLVYTVINKFKLERSVIYLSFAISFIFIFLAPIVYALDKLMTFYEYLIYISYILPTLIIFYNIWRKEPYKQSPFLQMATYFLLTYTICFEIHNLIYLPDNYLDEEYNLIVLPIIWAVIGFAFLLVGVKKQLKNASLFGLFLFVLILLKLYLVDVWNMNNLFRIISFIALGVLILITSFMHQKLKNIMAKIINKKEE